MDHREQIEVDLIKLTDGARLMRLSYQPLGLVLEKKLEANRPVTKQKTQLFDIFEAALAKAELSAA